MSTVFLHSRQKASAGGKEVNILSPITAADIGKVIWVTQPSQFNFSAPYYFKDCTRRCWIQLSIQTRMLYMHLLCLGVHELLRCYLHWSAHFRLLHFTPYLYITVWVWSLHNSGPPLQRQPNQQLHGFQRTRTTEEVILSTTFHRT